MHSGKNPSEQKLSSDAPITEPSEPRCAPPLSLQLPVEFLAPVESKTDMEITF